MKFDIYVDADSIQRNLRSIILKAAVRLDTAAFFVADRKLPDVEQFIAEDTHRIRVEKQNSELKSKIKMITVDTGENSADDKIVELAGANSLCITHDIPLAARLLDKGCFVINDRGDSYTSDNIKTLLKDRDVNATLREWGLSPDKQKSQTASSVKAFADNFDRLITKMQVI